MPGNPGQRTATSQWFLERKSTFARQQVVLNPSASCEITQSNVFPIYNEREGTVKCVTPLFLTPLLLCIFPFVCCRYQLLPGRASRCAARCTPCVRLVRQGVDESAHCGCSGSGGGFDECKTTERLTWPAGSVFSLSLYICLTKYRCTTW